MQVESPDIVDGIERLFIRRGEQLHDDSRREPVSALAHALQCAQLAEWAHADVSPVAAALLHDIGHLLASAGNGLPDGIDGPSRRRSPLSRRRPSRSSRCSCGAGTT